MPVDLGKVTPGSPSDAVPLAVPRHEGVIPAPTVDPVPPGTAVDAVAAIATKKHVVSRAAIDDIVAAPPIQTIVAPSSADHVSVRRSVQSIVSGFAQYGATAGRLGG